MSNSYDNGRYGTVQTVAVLIDPLANNDADAVAQKIKLFTKSKILAANAYAQVVGGATTSGVTIKSGTNSIGAVVTGTLAGPTDGTLTETTMEAGDELCFHTIKATETGVFLVAVKYQETF